MNPTYLKMGGAAVAGFIVGSAISYYFTRQMMIDKFTVIVEEPAEERPTQTVNEPEDSKYGHIRFKNLPPEEPELDKVKVFTHYKPPQEGRITKDTEFTPDNFRKFMREGMDMTGMEDEWDYDEEMSKRTPDRPYVIHVDEFRDDNKEYSKISLDYYVVDDVVVDERNMLLPNTDDILGEDNLKRFGDGSGDTEIVYIRNEKLESDFEVTKTLGDYVADVYGYIEHSEKRRPPKFHMDWE